MAELAKRRSPTTAPLRSKVSVLITQLIACAWEQFVNMHFDEIRGFSPSSTAPSHRES